MTIEKMIRLTMHSTQKKRLVLGSDQKTKQIYLGSFFKKQQYKLQIQWVEEKSSSGKKFKSPKK